MLLCPPPSNDEIRRLLHALREPLGAFSIELELLDMQSMTTADQARLKRMRIEMDRAASALDEIDFVVDNGHSKPNASPTPRPLQESTPSPRLPRS
jgi:hypothetical protein